MRYALVVALVFAVLLAGCAGSPGGSTTTAETEPSTGTGAQTPTESSEIPPNATPANTVSFETLTERQQEAFLDARDGAVSFAPDSPCITDDADYHAENYSEIVQPFRTHEYVTYEGQHYATTVATGATTYLSKSYQLRQATPEPNDTVVAFEDLSAENQTYIQRAIYPDEYETPHRCASPDVLRRFLSDAFLQYENGTYAAEITLVEDAPEYLLTVTEYGVNGSSGS
ncbi:hypothetical protein BRD00_04240 [Halobacteriales archaeon QS_8_69_26]|nr:MAG: hypothetical protein BRD00_04240 [Halobacteriales archaeon QS_8_69_26]